MKLLEDWCPCGLCGLFDSDGNPRESNIHLPGDYRNYLNPEEVQEGMIIFVPDAREEPFTAMGPGYLHFVGENWAIWCLPTTEGDISFNGDASILCLFLTEE